MKKRQLTKWMAVVLAGTMTLGLAACGSKEDESAGKGEQPTSQGEEKPTGQEEQPGGQGEDSDDGEEGKYTILRDENGNVYDLGGMEIVLRDWWTNPDQVEENKSAYDEAREEYLEWIQTTYNFTFVQKAISDWGSTPEDFANYVIGGGSDENFLFILRAGAEFVSAMNNNLMYDLTTLDCLDFSEYKWRNRTHEMASVGNAVYGMSGEYPEAKGGMYFHKAVLESAGISAQDIYDLQENMQWTWDKFAEICEKVHADTDNDGVVDRYAMANFSACWYPEAVFSNGGHFIARDAEGNLYNDLESETTLEALNWALDMWDKYDGHSYYPEDATWDYWLTAFKEGKAAFMADEAYRAGQMREEDGMVGEFGFVCFPMGPKMTDYANVWSNNPVCIPSCYDKDKAWKLAFAYNLWTEPVPGFDEDAAFKYNYYKSFRDTESVDLTIARLETNGYLTYHGFVPGIDLGPDLYWAINKDNTPAQQAETIRPVWASFLEELKK